MKIVKFTQSSCTPCRILEMMMQHIGAKEDESVILDVDMSFDEAKDMFEINTTPTLILLDDEGQEIDRVSGTNQKQVEDLFAKKG